MLLHETEQFSVAYPFRTPVEALLRATGARGGCSISDAGNRIVRKYPPTVVQVKLYHPAESPEQVFTFVTRPREATEEVLDRGAQDRATEAAKRSTREHD